jgi:hypothetical protein
MKRETVGSVLWLLGSLLLVAALCSDRWLRLDGHLVGLWPRYEHDWAILRAIVFWGGVVAVGLGLPALWSRAHRLCVVALALAVAELLAGLSYLTLPDGATELGPGAALFLLGAAMLIAAPPLLSEAARDKEDIRGETLGGKRHGRQLVYQRGRLVRVEQWDRGEVTASSPVGDDGLLRAP